jgi:hypothetical protein
MKELKKSVNDVSRPQSLLCLDNPSYWDGMQSKDSFVLNLGRLPCGTMLESQVALAW